MGVSSKVVERMTLSAFDGAALELDPESDEFDATIPFGALTWSRFCPECLSGSHGRWQLAWRLGWSFACTLHNSLLVDVCPSCGARQRRQQIYRHVPAPTLCACGYSLTSVSATRLPADHEIIVVQRAIFDVIKENDFSFGVFGTRRIHSRTLLEAIRSLANRVLNYASIPGLTAVKSVKLLPWLSEDALAAIPLVRRSALNNKAPSRAIDAAVGITAALTILVAPSIERAGFRARWLVDGQNADTGPAELRTCDRDGWMPVAIVLTASRSRLGPELQLRYRTAITQPCAHDVDLDEVRSIAAALPSALWPAWSEQLLLDLRITDVVRSSLCSATLLAGSKVTPVQAALLFGEVVTPNAMNERLWVLWGSSCWQSICAALIRLSDYLVDFGSPIDYERRRHLDYSTFLSDGDWETICRHAGDMAVTPCDGMGARLHMIEELSGIPPQRIQISTGSVGGPEPRKLVNNFRRSLLPRVAALLREHAGLPGTPWHP